MSLRKRKSLQIRRTLTRKNPDPDKPQAGEEQINHSFRHRLINGRISTGISILRQAGKTWKTAYEYAVSVLEDEDATQEEIDQALRRS